MFFFLFASLVVGSEIPCNVDDETLEDSIGIYCDDRIDRQVIRFNDDHYIQYMCFDRYEGLIAFGDIFCRQGESHLPEINGEPKT